MYILYFRNPNTPIKVETMLDIEWPSYDAHHGKYFAFEKSVSKSSVRSNFCAESYGFWYQLIPKYPGIQFRLPCTPPGQFFMGAKLFIGTPWMGNKGVLKKILVWAM